jgi:hypothetical protein
MVMNCELGGILKAVTYSKAIFCFTARTKRDRKTTDLTTSNTAFTYFRSLWDMLIKNVQSILIIRDAIGEFPD